MRQSRGGRLVVPRPGEYTLRVGCAGRPGERAVTVARMPLAVGHEWATSSMLAEQDPIRGCAALPIHVEAGAEVGGEVVLYVDLCEVPYRCLELRLPLRFDVEEVSGQEPAPNPEDGEDFREMRDWLAGMGFEGNNCVLFAVNLAKFSVAAEEQAQGSEMELELD